MATKILMTAGVVLWVAVLVLIVTAGSQWRAEDQTRVEALPGVITLTPGCDLATLRATLAKLTPGELAAVGYVGDDGNWHALTADVLRGR